MNVLILMYFHISCFYVNFRGIRECDAIGYMFSLMRKQFHLIASRPYHAAQSVRKLWNITCFGEVGRQADVSGDNLAPGVTGWGMAYT